MVVKTRNKEIAFGILIIILVVLAIKGLIIVSQFIGYASYLQTDGGTITEIELELAFDVSHWSGVYGTAWGVGWTQEWYYNFTGNVTLTEDDNEKHLLFTCFAQDAEHEIYASMVPEDEIIFDSLVAATAAEIDDYLNISTGEFFSATNTFTSTETFDVGGRDVIAPAMHTYAWNSQNSTSFVTGILKDSNDNLVIVTKVLESPIDGFTGERFNYQMLLPIHNTEWQDYYLWSDPTDTCPEGQGTAPWEGYVYGNVTDTSGNPLGGVIVEIGGEATYSDNTTGFYNVTVREGNWTVYAMKTGYEIYRSNVTVVRENGTAHNIVMVAKQPPYPPLTGIGPGEDAPGTTTTTGVDAEGTKTKSGEYDMPPVVQRPKKIEGTDYIVSISEINRKLRLGNFLQEKVTLYSFKEKAANIYFTIEGNVSSLIKMDKESMILLSRSDDSVTLTIFGVGDPGIYNGSLVMSGDINVSIPIIIEILPKEMLPVQALLIDLELNKNVVYPGSSLKFKTDLRNLLTDLQYPVQLLYTIQDIEGKETIWSYETNVFLRTSFSLLKNALITAKAKPGDYILRVTANYLGLSAGTSTIFRISTPWYLVTIIGPIKMWHLLLFLLLVALGLVAYWQIKRNIESKKKFHLKVDLNELPKPGPRSIPVGRIAETDHKTYFSLEAFMTHCIDAGSTGSGKSVSAQVIVEEMLMKGIAVVVFDPTAQWTGMLRKCTDKTMLALYPLFGMKPTDAKAFSGNIRQITNPREIIEIRKYIKPGEIQVFACHKLEPREMDMFVANSIREIFRANFQESRTLKVLFVYDEVHRLLPKFGGSGEGFLQIERGCREFRKWGLGILLISQVLSDFVGTIKANINTEIQMRTRDEGDLERIKVKYGEDVLRSLVKATVGSGMVENPHYNIGKPYFVAFRPLLHSVQRLTDEEIEKYNEYNDKIDQLQFELEQLEKEGIDVFDLKLELKLATDKVKTGNFNMVQIYLDGLTPRIQKHWDKLGKKPEKLEKKLVSETELQEAITRAKKARSDYEAMMKKEASASGEGEEKKDKGAINFFKKDVEPDKILKLVNGMLVINMASLYDEISAMKDDDYAKHVTENKNDFANWVREAVGDAELADHMSLAVEKKDILSLIDLRKNQKPLPKLEPDKIKKLKEIKAFSELSGEPSEIKKKAEVEPQPKEQTEKAKQAGQQKEAQSSDTPPAKFFEKNAEPEDMLVLVNGILVMNLDSLHDELVNMSDGDFAKHVNGQKNDFADWTRNIIGDALLAEQLGAMSKREDVIKCIELRKSNRLPQAVSPRKPENGEKKSAKPGLEEKVKGAKPVPAADSGVQEAEISYSFKLETGEEIKTLNELQDKVKNMDDASFKHYVSDDYNKFADWVRDGLHNKELADKISRIHDRNKLLEALSSA
ncbi:DUF87 domain-containing protein [Candidatus Woesearchaeota archaeon]|nr:DUF87 domain-containing protein [Candidatus Woesearchaeota archaeon]